MWIFFWANMFCYDLRKSFQTLPFKSWLKDRMFVYLAGKSQEVEAEQACLPLL